MDNKKALFGLFFIVVISILVALLTVVPVSDNKDIYITVEVEQPALTSANIKEVSTEVKSHTLMSVGSVWDALEIIDDITHGEDVTIKASCGAISDSTTIDGIERWNSETVELKLTNVPENYHDVTIELLENTVVKDTKQVLV